MWNKERDREREKGRRRRIDTETRKSRDIYLQKKQDARKRKKYSLEIFKIPGNSWGELRFPGISWNSRTGNPCGYCIKRPNH